MVVLLTTGSQAFAGDARAQQPADNVIHTWNTEALDTVRIGRL